MLEDIKKTLWATADKLRANMDAAEYKHLVLGLIFVKYISDTFETRRDDLRAELTKDGIRGEQLNRLFESRDEYTAERVFWVPPGLQRRCLPCTGRHRRGRARDSRR